MARADLGQMVGFDRGGVETSLSWGQWECHWDKAKTSCQDWTGDENWEAVGIQMGLKPRFQCFHKINVLSGLCSSDIFLQELFGIQMFFRL